MGQDPNEAVARFQQAIARSWYMVEKYARKKAYVLNPDRPVLEKVVRSLARRQILYGFRYCPWRELSGDPVEDRKKICPCDWHEEEIALEGICTCRLFCSQDYAASVGSDSSTRKVASKSDS